MSTKTKIELQCENCDHKFNRRIYDHRYNLKRGRRVFCTKKCGNEAMRTEKAERIHGLQNYENLKNYRKSIGVKSDFEKSMTHILQKCRNRKKFVITITKQDLRDQWHSQKGICPYSGIQLTLPGYWSKNDKSISASLDRIDSSKGYVKGNIQFVCVLINLMKSDLEHVEVVNFCKQITQHWNKQLDSKGD